MAASPDLIARAPAGNVSVIDQDASHAGHIAGVMAQLGVAVQVYPTAGDFLARPAPDPDCIICEMTLPDMSGIDLIHALRARGSLTPVILMTDAGDIPSAVAGMRSGALDFLEKASADRLLGRHVSRLIRRNETPAPA